MPDNVELERRRLGGRWLLAMKAKRLVAMAVATASVALVLGACLPAGAQSNPPPAPNTWLGQTYTQNQIISEPDVLTTPKVDFMYSSGFGGTVNIPLRTFTKMGQWSKLYNPLNHLPPWVQPGTSVWTPDVHKAGNTYVMWFSAMSRSTPPGSPRAHLRCLGSAVSKSPYGPFKTNAAAPQLCQWSEYGDIDPRTFMDGSQEYLLWKSNNNVAPHYSPTKIWSQKLAANGTTLEGSPTVILQNSRPWEGGVVESPDMVTNQGHYYLFFSGNSAAVPASGIGLATCQGPSGPCKDSYKGPWLGSNTGGAGPDEETLFTQGGNYWLLYTPNSTYFKGAYPTLAVSRLGFGPHAPYVAAFAGAQPNP